MEVVEPVPLVLDFKGQVPQSVPIQIGRMDVARIDQRQMGDGDDDVARKGLHLVRRNLDAADGGLQGRNPAPVMSLRHGARTGLPRIVERVYGTTGKMQKRRMNMAYHVEGEIAEISIGGKIGSKKDLIGVRLVPSPDSIHRDGDTEKVLLMGEAESLLKPRGEFEKMVFLIENHISPEMLVLCRNNRNRVCVTFEQGANLNTPIPVTKLTIR